MLVTHFPDMAFHAQSMRWDKKTVDNFNPNTKMEACTRSYWEHSRENIELFEQKLSNFLYGMMMFELRLKHKNN